MSQKLYESYRWIVPFKTGAIQGKTAIIRGKALHATLSENLRSYIMEELTRSARSLARKYIDVNHEYSTWQRHTHAYEAGDTAIPPGPKPRLKGHVEDAEFEDGFIEYWGKINHPEYVEKLRDRDAMTVEEYVAKWGKHPITSVSVDATYRFGREAGQGRIEPRGIIFNGLSLVEDPEQPGVDGTSVEVLAIKEMRGTTPQLALFQSMLRERNIMTEIVDFTENEGDTTRKHLLEVQPDVATDTDEQRIMTHYGFDLAEWEALDSEVRLSYLIQGVPATEAEEDPEDEEEDEEEKPKEDDEEEEDEATVEVTVEDSTAPTEHTHDIAITLPPDFQEALNLALSTMDPPAETATPDTPVEDTPLPDLSAKKHALEHEELKLLAMHAHRRTNENRHGLSETRRSIRSLKEWTEKSNTLVNQLTDAMQKMAVFSNENRASIQQVAQDVNTSIQDFSNELGKVVASAQTEISDILGTEIGDVKTRLTDHTHPQIHDLAETLQRHTHPQLNELVDAMNAYPAQLDALDNKVTTRVDAIDTGQEQLQEIRTMFQEYQSEKAKTLTETVIKTNSLSSIMPTIETRLDRLEEKVLTPSPLTVEASEDDALPSAPLRPAGRSDPATG